MFYLYLCSTMKITSIKILLPLSRTLILQSKLKNRLSDSFDRLNKLVFVFKAFSRATRYVSANGPYICRRRDIFTRWHLVRIYLIASSAKVFGHCSVRYIHTLHTVLNIVGWSDWILHVKLRKCVSVLKF